MQIVYTFSHHLNIYTVYRYLHSLHSLNRYLHSLKHIPNALYRATESTESTSFIFFNQSQATDARAAAGLYLAPGEETRRVFFNFDIDVHRV